MNAPHQLSPAGKLITAFTLTVVGGFVDAVGYIALYQIFTANMSGNSIHLGMGAADLNISQFARPACAIASYVGALILGRIALQIAARAEWRRIASFTLGAEALLLLIFSHARLAMHGGQVVDMSSPAYFAMIAGLACAMGIQTATLTHLGALTIYTTFVTGTLTKFSESFTRALFWGYDELRAGNSLSHIVGKAPGQVDSRDSVFLLLVWICYVVGAALGAITKRVWELKALYFPVGVLVILILIDVLRPISGDEEQRQRAGPRKG